MEEASPHPPGSGPGRGSRDFAPGDPLPPLADLLPREELDRLSTLQLLDLIASKLPARHSALLDLVYLRDRIVGLKETNDQARQALEEVR